MKERLKYLSLSAADGLYRSVAENAERYKRGHFVDMAQSGGWSAELSIAVDMAPLRDLDPEVNPLAEYENSLRVWRALGQLPPAVAIENRVWARLAHLDCLEFCRARWFKNLEGDELEKVVKKHMFAQSLTQYRDDHALARLWWNYYIASRLCPEEPATALRAFLKSADIRLNFIERPWIASRRALGRGIIRLMTYDAWVTSTESNFRRIMTTINRLGSGIAFEVLSDREIDKFLMRSRKLAETADW
jgi:hypothetical protein